MTECKKLKIHNQADVVVCGGGPAGFAASVRAARLGARVRLLESLSALGGVWSMGMLSTVSDMRQKTSFIREFETCLERMSAAPLRRDLSCVHPTVEHAFSISPEWVKGAMEAMCLDAGVQVRLYSPVVAVEREGSAITGVVTESKSGRECWRAPVFVDATGDGDVAAGAGCGFEKGHPDHGRMQPMSMHALFCGVNEEDMLPYICWGRAPDDKRPRKSFAEELKRAGVEVSYGMPGIHQLGGGLFFLGVNHEYEPDSIDADALSRATLRGRAECLRVIAGLKRLGGIWKNIEAAVSSPSIGVREGRRIHGRYTLTQDDLVNGKRHEDAVCRVTFPVDIHSTDPGKDKGYGNGGVKAKPYDIPARALIAADVDNLFLAGRCISGDFVAHASYRVVGNALVMGEAVGVMAALASKTGKPPHDVPFVDVKPHLDPVV